MVHVYACQYHSALANTNSMSYLGYWYCTVEADIRSIHKLLQFWDNLRIVMKCNVFRLSSLFYLQKLILYSKDLMISNIQYYCTLFLKNKRLFLNELKLCSRRILKFIALNIYQCDEILAVLINRKGLLIPASKFLDGSTFLTVLIQLHLLNGQFQNKHGQ